jgi:hypothetical protein
LRESLTEMQRREAVVFLRVDQLTAQFDESPRDARTSSGRARR